MMMQPKMPKERACDILLDVLAAIRDGLPATAARAALRLHELEHEEIDERLRRLLRCPDTYAVVMENFDELVRLLKIRFPLCGPAPGRENGL